MEVSSGFAGHAVVVANQHGVIELWSSGAQKLFGYSAAEAVGQPLDLIVAEPYREPHWANFRRAMETGVSTLDGQSFELPVQHRNGTGTTVSGQLVLLRDAAKRPIGAMGIFASPE